MSAGACAFSGNVAPVPRLGLFSSGLPPAFAGTIPRLQPWVTEFPVDDGNAIVPCGFDMWSRDDWTCNFDVDIVELAVRMDIAAVQEFLVIQLQISIELRRAISCRMNPVNTDIAIAENEFRRILVTEIEIILQIDVPAFVVDGVGMNPRIEIR